ncbi:M28 family peptidase [Hugenholtzia roseola]|uniref:M28 family peptidase n=1 Tax=Hugenholtzia roseola TaxID=1002 RepID=UPI0004220E9F|nr:M28 family peptidase [Hugenholtzia roseola]
MRGLAGFVAILMMAFAFYWSIRSVSPSGLKSEDSITEFSAIRAMDFVKKIAATPHPAGSAALDSVRLFLTATVKKIGYEPTVQSAIVFDSLRKDLRIGFVKNILVRIKGRASSKIGRKAILVVAHYDSAEGANGAADDGAACGAILEVLQILKQTDLTNPLENDLIFLFSDGEETGLFGATAFLEQHPWAKEVGLVINFEARGTSGASMMFQTSPNNEWLIRQFAAATKEHRFRALTSSVAVGIYEQMPNDTDGTIFLRDSLPLLNFAFIGNVEKYHTPLDAPQNLNLGSLQQHGDYLLALIRHFGNLDLAEAKGGRSLIFFSDPLGGIFHFAPSPLFFQIWIGVAIAFVVVAATSLRSLRWWAILLSLVLYPLLILLFGVLFHGLWRWIVKVHEPNFSVFPYELTYFDTLYFTAFVLLAFGLILILYALLRGDTSEKRINLLEVFTGTLFWWILGAYFVLSSNEKLLVQSSYLVSIPLGIGFLSWLYLLLRGKKAKYHLLDVLILGAGASLVVYIWWFPIQMFPQALPSLTLAEGVALQGRTVSVMLILLISGLLLPLYEIFSHTWRWVLGLLGMMSGILLLMWCSLQVGFQPHQPRPNSLFFVSDLVENRSFWGTETKILDEYLTPYFNSTQQKDTTLYFYEKKYANRFTLNPLDTCFTLPAPEIELIERKGDLWKLKIVSQRKGHFIRLSTTDSLWVYPQQPLHSEKDSLKEKQATSKPLKGYAHLNLFALPDSGAVFYAQSQKDTLIFSLIEAKRDFAELDSLAPAKRGKNFMRGISFFSDAVWLKNQYTLMKPKEK